MIDWFKSTLTEIKIISTEKKIVNEWNTVFEVVIFTLVYPKKSSSIHTHNDNDYDVEDKVNTENFLCPTLTS